MHGGRAGRPKGHPEHPNSRAARLEGRRRWVERMREAKARGEIARFPGGRRAKGLPPLSSDPKVRKAQRIIEAEMAKKAVPTGKVIAASTWEEMSRGQKLETAADNALVIAMKILQLGVNGSNLKQLAIVKDTALSIIGYQIRVEAGPQAALAADHLSDEERQRKGEEARERALASIREAFEEVYSGDQSQPLPVWLRPEPADTDTTDTADTAEPVIDAPVAEEPPASEPAVPPPVNGLSIEERDARVHGRNYAREDPADRNVARLPQRWRPPKPSGSGWGA